MQVWDPALYYEEGLAQQNLNICDALQKITGQIIDSVYWVSQTTNTGPYKAVLGH